MLSTTRKFLQARPLSTTALVIVLAVGAAACGGSSTPSGGSPSSSPSDSVDVAAVASEMLGEGFDADFDLTMSMSLLGQQMSVTGAGRMVGGDSEAEMTVSGLGKKLKVATVMVDGATYEKSGEGPWVKAPGAGLGSDFGLSLARVDSKAPLRVSKEITWHGEQVQVLTRDLSGRAAVGALGLEEKVDKVFLEQRILVIDDGTPVQLVGNVVTTTAGQQVKLHVVLEFEPLATSEPIVVPDNPWKQVPVLNGLRAAMPATWDHEFDKECGTCDRFYGGDGAQLLLVSDPSYRAIEESIHMVMQMVGDRGGTSTKHHSQDINGVTWQVASMVDRSRGGGRSSLTAGTAVIGGRSVLVFSWDDPGHTQDGRQLFEEFASTIELST